MTYFESITYLTGHYLQICQFAVRNAFRVVALSEGKERETEYLKGSAALLESLEAIAQGYAKEHKGDSEKELVQFFSSHQGLSRKDLGQLKKVLSIRTDLMSSFFIDNSAAFGREEEDVYEEKIKELKADVGLADGLNVALAKAAEKLYSRF